MKVVIVESPNKIKKISTILGDGYKVIASLGHIRDLDKNSIGIDLKSFDAKYTITKYKVVGDLKKYCRDASTIYIATDPDREGDGIAWHLQEVLNIKYPRARRMTFNEITKDAILKALKKANNEGFLDMNSVNAYQARRFIDRIAGFKASPVLWRNIKGAKSAGRVQSVTTRLAIEKEIEIVKHVPEERYNISGIFEHDINATLKQTIKSHQESLDVLGLCKKSVFMTNDKEQKIIYNNSPPAFKTSVLQQEAGKRYHMSPKESMRIAQTLYEKGKITYHRTDTSRLSDYFKNNIHDFVIGKYGIEYLGEDRKTILKKGTQAAHEAIRPTNIHTLFLDNKFQQKEKMIYRMIWTRAVASLMAPEKCNKHTIKISISKSDKYYFSATHIESIFLGFKILTKDNTLDSKNKILLTLQNNQELTYKKIESQQTFTDSPKRYTESSLVKELENKGIGRPSTYANIINTIQLRKYVEKKKSETKKKECFLDILEKGNIDNKKIEVEFGDKSQRLFPTDLGIKVTDFLVKNLEYLMDYKFTSNLENELDMISNGDKNYKETLTQFTTILLKLIKEVPEKPKEDKINRTIGKYNKCNVDFYVGQYGPFLKYKKKCFTLPGHYKEMQDITLEQAIEVITTKNYLFEHKCSVYNNQGVIQALRGPYGLYLKFIPEKGKDINKPLPKKLREDEESVLKLTLEECLEFFKKSKYRN